MTPADMTPEDIQAALTPDELALMDEIFQEGVTFFTNNPDLRSTAPVAGETCRYLLVDPDGLRMCFVGRHLGRSMLFRLGGIAATDFAGANVRGIEHKAARDALNACGVEDSRHETLVPSGSDSYRVGDARHKRYVALLAFWESCQKWHDHSDYWDPVGLREAGMKQANSIARRFGFSLPFPHHEEKIAQGG